MSRLLLVLALLTGCDRVFGLNHLTPVDVDAASADANLCFGKYASGALLQVCLQALPSPGPRPLPPTIDTGGSTTECDLQPMQTGGPDVCVIAAQNITIDTLIRAHGSRPLVLVATDTLSISPSGGIDVSTGRGLGLGAGANDNACVNAGDGMMIANTFGGGAGGSFATIGGAGGNAGNGAAAGQPSGPTTLLSVVRGGCKGGSGDGGVLGGGAGGGAVYLIAGTSIEMRGLIDASGGGGGGATVIHRGGSGGGSGGFIALDSPLITIESTARLAANGGGGGGGGDTTTGLGMNGMEADLTMDPFPARGGPGGGGTGGGGGKGADRNTVAAKGSNGTSATNGGGGGGGGGIGFIRAYAPAPTIAPTAGISPAIP